MNLKNAALLALTGMLPLTILTAIDFIKTISGLAGGLVPAATLLRSLIYVLASLCVTIFFAVFNRNQSR